MDIFALNPDRQVKLQYWLDVVRQCRASGLLGLLLQLPELRLQRYGNPASGGEVSQAGKDQMALINPAGAVRSSSYGLIEYINDVKREYTEVLVKQNINGRTDTVYTYGNERISREMFSRTSRAACYIIQDNQEEKRVLQNE